MLNFLLKGFHLFEHKSLLTFSKAISVVVADKCIFINDLTYSIIKVIHSKTIDLIDSSS